MLNIQIQPIPLGICTAYLIRDKGAILVDAGPPNKGKAFKRFIDRNGIKPDDIQLTVLTHGHWDHIGSARDIKEITGSLIAMHRQDKETLETPYVEVPPGATLWGKIFKSMMVPFSAMVRIPKTRVEAVLKEEIFSLAGFGIHGAVYHTPGHSPGSVSILLETGDCFVGDLAMNRAPFRLRPGFPIFAENLDQVRESWKLLLDSGAQTIYPAHGKPFSADLMRRRLS